MRIVSFRPIAESELLDVIGWYEDQQRGLGLRFNATVDAGISAALKFPNRYPTFYVRQRRILVSPYPFGVLYLVEPERLVVTAVVDLRSDPRTLRRRAAREE